MKMHITFMQSMAAFSLASSASSLAEISSSSSLAAAKSWIDRHFNARTLWARMRPSVPLPTSLPFLAAPWSRPPSPLPRVCASGPCPDDGAIGGRRGETAQNAHQTAASLTRFKKEKLLFCGEGVEYFFQKSNFYLGPDTWWPSAGASPQ